MKARAETNQVNNEGKKLSNVAKDPEVLVVLKKWGIISGNGWTKSKLWTRHFFTGIENGFDAEEYQNDDESDEDWTFKKCKNTVIVILFSCFEFYIL